jgi:hypothetical protein
MPVQSVALWAVLSALGIAYASLVYARRELPVRGRRWLAALRGASLSAVILILVNPSLPGAVNAPSPRILLDRSGSMEMVDSMEVERALREARSAMGREAVVADFDDPSRIGPLLVAAVESGAGEISVVTDLRLSDAVAAEAVVRGAPTSVRWVDLGRALDNAGVAALEVDPATLTGDPVTGVVTVVGERAGGEGPVEVTLSLRMSDGTSRDTALAVTPGRATRVPFTLVPSAREGTHLLEARTSLEGDVFPADDRLQALVERDRGGGDVVLLSVAPDWEPRFLLPVLGEVTGLPARGFLSLGERGFLRSGGTPGVADRSEVEVALSQARLVVFQGPVPGWAADALLPETPSIVLPAEESDAGPGGEWYLSPDVPASPVAAELAGVSVLGLPPLSVARAGARGAGAGARVAGAATPGPSGIPVIELQLAGRGEAIPALYLGETAAGRRATAAARGFWRWGFRDGEGREVYRRLWSGVAGWLLAGGADGGVAAVAGPVSTRLGPGSRGTWQFPQAAGGRASVRFAADTALRIPEMGGGAPDAGGSPEAGAARAAGASTATGAAPGPAPPSPGVEVSLDSLGRASLPSPETPGVYRWRAEFTRGPDTIPPAEGRILVAAPRLDLLHPRAVSLLEVQAAGPPGGASGAGRPLRTHPAPYLLLLVLLSAEWIGRRRSGLR